jgi:hypothetical protein
LEVGVIAKVGQEQYFASFYATGSGLSPQDKPTALVQEKARLKGRATRFLDAGSYFFVLPECECSPPFTEASCEGAFCEPLLFPLCGWLPACWDC